MPSSIPIDFSSRPQRGEVVPEIRSYKAPWRGELLLVCKKCQRKIDKPKALANLRKWFKKRSKSDSANAPEVRIVGVDCVKMCPKAGVTVMRQHQLGEQGREVSILRSKADLEGLYALLSSDPAHIKRAS